MSVRAFRLAYDGTPYHGFQRQPDVPTVEDELFDALRALEIFDDADKPRGYAAAGRTDAGVSALAQTVAFDVPEWLTPLALNGELPRDVRAWAHADAPDGFHATHDAVAREYRYQLHAPGADVARARDAAAAFEGEHDFHNLTTDDEGTVRQIDAVDVASGRVLASGGSMDEQSESVGVSASEASGGSMDEQSESIGEFLVVTVRAPGFCRHQVRRIVSLLGAVATGERPIERIDVALSDAVLSGPDGIPSSPAHPLVLADVEYPNLSFAVDEDAAANARTVFDGKRVEHRARAAVAGTVTDRIGDDE